MGKSTLRAVVAALLLLAIIVLAITNVLPPIGSDNYWWVVLTFAVIAFFAKLYWRLTTGSWNNPRSRQGRR